MQHCLSSFWVFLLSLLATGVYAQGNLIGVIKDADNKTLLVGALIELEGTDYFDQTNASGTFELTNIPNGSYTVIFTVEGYTSIKREVTLSDNTVNMGTIELTNIGVDNPDGEDIIPTIMLSDEDLESGSSNTQSISGILNANRDVFTSKVAFAWSAGRFRVRGYNSDFTQVYMNNIPMNDLESGRPTWWSWSGLNDVMRNRVSSIGLEDVSYSVGDLGGASMIDSRAGSQRRGTSLTYSLGNRSYEHRVMLTHSTGLLPSGWALSGSLSWRYSQNGAYIKGAHYNALSYFLSVERRKGKHSFSFTAMGAPSVRGKGSPATQEQFGLANSHYYNPNWGYQTSGKTGKQQIRNSRVTTSHQPLFILQQKSQLSDKVRLTTAVSYQFGIYGSSALDWYDAQDPRPQYYRNLPSYVADPDMSRRISDLYVFNESVRQVQWDRLYEINRNAVDTILDANGIAGNIVAGSRARYVVEQRRYDSKKANANIFLNANVTDNLTIDGGLTYQYYTSRNFKVLEDLLGADFYIDINRFAERDMGHLGDPSLYQNDIRNPNRILQVGDEFGWNYEAHVHKGSAWAQARLTLPKIDLFISGSGSYTTFWRKGNYQNGLFPNNSLGKSEAQEFWNHTVKGGATYKFNGRNYVFVNASHQTKAPYFRYSYASPRTRDQLVPNINSSMQYSFEGGYVLKAPRVKANITAYYTKVEKDVFQRNFYLDRSGSESGIGGTFVNYIMKGVDKQHMGLELAGEVNLEGNVTLSAGAAIGEYIYTSRPEAFVYQDNSPQVGETRTVYLKNFYLPNTPQLVLNTGVWWRAPKFWSFSLNVNYFARNFADINFDRRTNRGVSVTGSPDLQYQQDALKPGTDLWRSILEQEQFGGQFTADIFIRKSWKIKRFFFIISLGVNNITHNIQMKNTSFEQFRFNYRTKDIEEFPPVYYYAFGANYMLNFTFRF